MDELTITDRAGDSVRMQCWPDGTAVLTAQSEGREIKVFLTAADAEAICERLIRSKLDNLFPTGQR